MGKGILAVCLLMLLGLGGCTEPPISGNADLVITYTFSGGGNLKIEAEYTGKANSRAGLWAGDCKAELEKNIDEYLALLERAGTAEQATLLEISRAVRDRAYCEFVPAGESSRLKVTTTVMAEEINRIGANDSSMGVRNDGDTSAKIPFFKSSIFRMMGVKENLGEVRVVVEGNVKELKPEGYALGGNEVYVYGNPSLLKEESIAVSYSPKETGIPPGILPGIIAIVALGAAGFFGFRILKRKGFLKSGKERPKGAKAGDDADAEQKAKSAVKEIVKMSAKEAAKTHKDMPRGASRIGKIVKTLERQKSRYEPEEIVQALIAEGYNEKDAAEVIKRLYRIE